MSLVRLFKVIVRIRGGVFLVNTRWCRLAPGSSRFLLLIYEFLAGWDQEEEFGNCARYIGLVLGFFLASNVGVQGLEMILALGLSDPRDSVLLHLVRVGGSPGVSLSR